MKRTKADDLPTVIRRPFQDSGLSMKALATQAGVGYQSVHGFCTGARSLTLGTASRICRVLGLELRPARRGRKR